MASRRRGLPAGSAPPSRTATVISLMILVNILDLLASKAPFLRLMVDHLLCPDITIVVFVSVNLENFQVPGKTAGAIKSELTGP
jgi:hypothetical protein